MVEDLGVVQVQLDPDSVAISFAKLRKLLKQVSVEAGEWSPPLWVRIRHGVKFKEEESTMKNSVVRTVIVLAAVSMAASSVIGAERMVVIEHFTATW